VTAFYTDTHRPTTAGQPTQHEKITVIQIVPSVFYFSIVLLKRQTKKLATAMITTLDSLCFC